MDNEPIGEMEDYEVVIALPLPVTVRTVEQRSPSVDMLDKLKEMLVDRGILSIAALRAMPTNPDIPFMKMLQSSLSDLQYLVANMHDRIMEDGKIALFLQDLLDMRNAIVHMNNVTSDIEKGKDVSKLAEEGMDKAVADGRACVVSLDNMDSIDVDILHTMAHKVAEVKGIEFSCLEHGLSKTKIVTWLKKHAFGIEGVAN